MDGLMKLTVRPAVGSDLDPLRELDLIARTDSDRVDYIRRTIASGSCFVAESPGEVLGYGVLTHHFYGHGMIEMVYVCEDRRRIGVGGALVEHMAASCRSSKLFTSTNASNQAMQSLLTKHGFVRSGFIENLDAGDPELVYFRTVG